MSGFELRRLYHYLTLCYKIVFGFDGLVRINSDEFCTFSPVLVLQTNYTSQYVKNASRRNFFIERLVNVHVEIALAVSVPLLSGFYTAAVLNNCFIVYCQIY